MGWTNSSDQGDATKPKKKQTLGATAQIKKKYNIETKVLGSGAFGKVFLASSVADSDFKVAIKVIPKKKIEGEIEQLMDEINILKSLDHPNIIKYYETYENNKYFYIVMEYWAGGELFEVIAKKAQKEGCFNESEAADMMTKLLKAINHCHSEGIAHRDIKPENIMITEDGDLKLIDFGLSKQVKDKKMKTIVGTPYYIAPEVLKGKYGVKCDIWSLGVIMYILLSGYLPFGGDNAKDVFQKVQNGIYSFDQKEWKKVSPEGIDLIKNMIQTDVKKRYSAEQWLKHKWFTVALQLKDNSERDPLDENILKNLMEFKGTSALKKAAMNILVKMLNPKEIRSLRIEFEKIDINNSGNIDASEISNALKATNQNIAESEIENIINEIDDNGNKQINYSEFIAATLNARKYLNESRLLLIFKEFDIDDTGFITMDSLKKAFEKLEKPLSNSDIKKILDAHDDSKDGKISFDEFKIMMLGEDDEELIELKTEKLKETENDKLS